MKRTHLSNQTGDALVMTLVVLGVVAGLSLVVAEMSKTIRESKKVARAKSIMTSVQQKILDLASEPSSYNACDTESGVESCKLNTDRFKGYTETPVPVPGAQCSSGVVCGVEVSTPTLEFDPVARASKFKTTIKYTGVDFSLKNIDINQIIPKEILQRFEYSCADANNNSPLFHGIKNIDGRPDCRSLKKCGKGKYIASVDPNTLEPNCVALPPLVDCGINQFLSAFSWIGGSNTTSVCRPRVDPYTVPEWWDGGEINLIPTGKPNKKPLLVTIDSVPNAFPLDGVLYYKNKGVQSWASFKATFSRAVSSIDCNKIKLHNDSVGYDVPLSSCTPNGRSVTFQGVATCGADIMCNDHWYTITVQQDAATSKDGVGNRRRSRQFKVDGK